MSATGPSSEPLYDPDRMRAEDLDLTDPKVFSAWLNHPVTEAMFEDYGRAFPHLPAAEKRREISAGLRVSEAARDTLIEVRDSLDAPEAVRAECRDLVEKLQPYIDGAKLRLLELDDED